MVGFFVKKNFFDGWDNFVSLALFNIVFMLLVFLFFTVLHLVSTIPFLSILLLIIFIAVLGILLQAVSNITAQIAHYQSFTVKELIQEIKKSWRHGGLFALLQGLCWFAVSVAVPYYFSFKNLLGLFLGVCVIWIFTVVQFSFLWFFPLRSQLEQNFRKCIKKCFILFFDNTAFTLFMFVYSIILIALTPIIAFLAPSVSGLLLAWNNAFKLRMYKYDWCEQHPEIPIQVARKQIPWEELLTEDRDTVGTRSIRNLIFPWKD